MQELIKRRYRVLGLGADDDVLAMFDQLGGEPADWVVYELGAFGRRHSAGDIVAMELFGGLPSHLEMIGSSRRRRRDHHVSGAHRTLAEELRTVRPRPRVGVGRRRGHAARQGRDGRLRTGSASSSAKMQATRICRTAPSDIDTKGAAMALATAPPRTPPTH